MTRTLVGSWSSFLNHYLESMVALLLFPFRIVVQGEDFEKQLVPRGFDPQSKNDTQEIPPKTIVSPMT